MLPRPVKARVTVLLAAVLAIFLWGATPFATKLAVAELDPLLVGALRTLLAAPLAVALLLVLRLKLPLSTPGRVFLLLSALGGFVVFPLLFSLGQQRTSVAHAALVLALLPIFTGLIAAVFVRRAPSRRWWLGSAVALAGAALLLDTRFGLLQPADSLFGSSLAGDLLVLASCLAASTGYVAGAKAAAEAGTWSVTFWGLVIAGVCLVPLLPWLVDPAELSRSTGMTWGAVGYLALGSSILGFAAWYWALAQGNIARTGQLQFAQPVVGVVLAAVFLDELLSGQLLLAAATILAGVAVVQSAKPPQVAG